MYTVATGNTIVVQDVNQIVNVLQQPSGGTETGRYFLLVTATAAGQYSIAYIRTTSQISVPVSVTIDQAVVAATNCSAPAADALTSFGFRIYTTSTASGFYQVAGNTTVHY